MNLTNCELCRQQVSPLAANCPACGHPLPPPKRKWWQIVSMQVPSAFFGVAFLVASFAGMLAAVAAAMTLNTAQTIMHQIFGALLLVFSAICGLAAVASAAQIED